MKHVAKTITALGLLSLALSGQTQPTGWKTLIEDGIGIENFQQVGNANWRVEDEALVADDGSPGFLVTPDSYKDFVLTAEFWADETTNSGIYFRCKDAVAITDTNCYEANIFDRRPEPRFGTGAIVHLAPVSAAAYAAGGRWNTLRITAIGSHLTVTLNGVQTANVRDTKLSKGPIALQYGFLPPDNTRGGAIKWRKVEVKPL